MLLAKNVIICSSIDIRAAHVLTRERARRLLTQGGFLYSTAAGLTCVSASIMDGPTDPPVCVHHSV
jgi:hypothetical protein